MEQSHTRQAGRRTELIPGEAVTMKKSLKLSVITQKRVENSLRGQSCGHGQIATGETFGQSQEIRLHILSMAGKEPWGSFGSEVTCTAKACHDLIGYQSRTIRAGNRGRF